MNALKDRLTRLVHHKAFQHGHQLAHIGYYGAVAWAALPKVYGVIAVLLFLTTVISALVGEVDEG